MTEDLKDEECVSKKPWGEVLNRSLKLFTFNLAREGGTSVGKVIFFGLLSLIFLGVAAYIIDSFTGWFSGWFDFWPFNSAPEPAPVVEEEKSGWFDWGSDDEPETAPEPVTPADGDADTKWYCKWNPIC